MSVETAVKNQPMKRSPIRKYSQKEIPKLKRKLWAVFTKYVKTKEKNICFTCGKKVESYASQGGHFIPKSVCGIELYFHEDNVHCQCSFCNLQLEGNRLEYAKRLGQVKVDELYKIKNQVIGKWTVEDYLKRISEYEQKLSTLPFA